eukprot:2174522-Rhodomonas_salina.3
MLERACSLPLVLVDAFAKRAAGLNAVSTASDLSPLNSTPDPSIQHGHVRWETVVACVFRAAPM